MGNKKSLRYIGKHAAMTCVLGLLAGVSPAQAQISGDVVKIGLISDLSGNYADVDGLGGV